MAQLVSVTCYTVHKKQRFTYCIQPGVFGGTVSPQQGQFFAILAINCPIGMESTTSRLVWLKVFPDKIHPAPPSCCPTPLKSKAEKS